MISVCIPIYNFNISDLLVELNRQINTLDIECEIILIDDASDKEYKLLINSCRSNETYIQLDKNVGRSKIRNLFLEYAKYDNLLFLDCDSLVVSNTFISDYIDFIKTNQNYNVVCGGRVYDDKQPERSKLLSWKYGMYRESQSADVRKSSPNNSFMTNNFLIEKRVFESVKFDERIVEYGHEDTLFGYELYKQNISISHIDNPVLNGDIADNKEFLSKTEKGIKNLVQILQYLNFDIDFIKNVSLLDFYYKTKKHKRLIKFLFIVSKPLLRFLLVNGFATLKMFDFYKLGFISEEIDRYSNK